MYGEILTPYLRRILEDGPVDVESALAHQFGAGLTEQFVDLLEKKRKTTLSMSGSGFAPRRMWLSRNIDDLHEDELVETQARGQLTMFTGHLLEGVLMGLLEAAGAPVRDTVMSGQPPLWICGGCFSAVAEGINFREVGPLPPDCGCGGEVLTGHSDGTVLIQGSMGEKDQEWNLECKSVNTLGFKRLLQTKKIDNAFGHLGQAHAYMHAKGQDTTLFIFINRDTLHMTEIIERFDEKVWENWKQNVTIAMEKGLPSECHESQVPRAPSGGYGENSIGLGFVCTYCKFTRVCFPEYQVHIVHGKDGIARPVWRK